jgi:hypothetical protein
MRHADAIAVGRKGINRNFSDRRQMARLTMKEEPTVGPITGESSGLKIT